MNKRDLILNMLHTNPAPDYIPAAFFLHFGPAYQRGQAAIDRHLEFFRTTGMDFVKIQYEQGVPKGISIQSPQDWANIPIVSEDFLDEPAQIAKGLVQAAGEEALVVQTLYSPLMWAARLAGEGTLAQHLREDPEAVAKGLEILAENIIALTRACRKAGVNGFYASTQGGEAARFGGSGVFSRYIKPSDLAVWDAIRDLPFNILHICDYEAPYNDLTPFLDYPGQVVNCSLQVGDRTMTPREAAEMFGRPYMGGMERKGVLATASPDGVRQAAAQVLANAPERFILAADCTVPANAPWENLKAAVETAHNFVR